MTFLLEDIKPLVKTGIEDAYISARLDIVAEQITQFVGSSTVSKWTTTPASVKLAAAKLVSHWYEMEDHDEAMSSESMSNYSRSVKLGESGMPESVEALLKPLRRIESI